MNQNRKEVLLVIYDKIVIALCIAAVSAVLIYTYNINNKAFELAQAQSRGYASIASKLRDLVLDGSMRVRQQMQTAYFSKAEHYLAKDEMDSINYIAAEIQGVAALLKKRAQKTSNVSEALAHVMHDLTNKFAIPEALNKKAVEETDEIILKLQAQFIDTYDSEVTQLATDDFKRFYDEFQNELPFYYRYPWTVAITALLIVLGFGIFLLLIV